MYIKYGQKKLNKLASKRLLFTEIRKPRPWKRRVVVVVPAVSILGGVLHLI